MKDIEYTPNRVIQGAVVKANEVTNFDVQTYIRADNGLLEDRTAEFANLKPENFVISDQKIIDAIFETIQDRWENINEKKKLLPFSDATNSPRYLGLYLQTEYKIKKPVANSIVRRWMADKYLATEMYNTRDSKYGIYVVKKPKIFTPQPFAEGTEVDD